MGPSLKTIFSSLLILCIAILFSCKKDEDSPKTVTNNQNQVNPPPPPIAQLNKSSFQQYEVAQIDLQNINLTSETYDGNIDTTTITAKGIGKNLHFMVPELPAGTYQLNINIEGKNYTFDLSIQSLNAVPNPDQYISDLSDSIFNFSAIDTAIARINEFAPSPVHQQNRAELLEMMNDFNSRVAQMNGQEKAMLAKFFKANESIFQGGFKEIAKDSLNFTKNIGILEDDVLAYRKKLAENLASLIYAAGGTFATISLCPVPGLQVLCVGSIAIAGYFWADLYEQMSMTLELYDKTFIHKQSDILEMNLKSFSLENDTVYELKIESERRTIYKEDVNSKNSLVKSFFPILDQSRDYWNKVVDFLNEISTIFSEDYKIEGDFPHPSGINSYKSQWIGESAEHHRIANINNPEVRLRSQSTVNNQIRVNFENKDTTEQNFTFDLIYEEGSYQSIQKISASIEAADSLIVNELENTSWYMKEYIWDGVRYTSNEWRIESYRIDSGQCTNTMISDRRARLVSETINFYVTDLNYRTIDEEATRSFQINANCVVSYDPWGSPVRTNELQNLGYEVISSNEVVFIDNSDPNDIFKDTLGFDVQGRELYIYYEGDVTIFFN